MRKKRSFLDKVKNYFWEEIDENGNPIKYEEEKDEFERDYKDYEEDIKIYSRDPSPKPNNRLFAAAVLVFAAFVFAFSGYLFAVHWFGGIAHGDDGKALDMGGLFSKKKEDNIEKVLIIGVDERPGEGARADTVVLAIINTTNPELKLLSIPRDTRVAIPGRGLDKINHALAYGGARLLTETVSSFLGIEVEKYVQLNFNSFKEVVDILGGIEYTVESRMYYPDENINLRPGPQHLDGDKALQYVRFRSDGRGDVGRVERQQKFMMEFISQKLELKNVLKIPELVGEINRSVRTNLSLAEMLSIAMAMKDLEKEKVQTEMLPGEAKYIGGVSYWIPSTQKLDDIFPSGQEGPLGGDPVLQSTKDDKAKPQS